MNKIDLSTRFRGFLPVVVDVETAGFDAKKDALLEIAAVMITVDENNQLTLGETHACHVEPFKGANLDEAICIAKTPASLSDDAKVLGRPRDFDITIRSILPNAGAGFLVVLTGAVLRMPGLPKHPQAEQIELEGDTIINLR